MITFVCHACGTSGCATSAGAVRCEKCGDVQHVRPDGAEAPSASGPADAREERAGPRLAQLWIPPGAEQGTLTPEPRPLPPGRPRLFRRAGIVAAGLAASAALAVGAGFAVRARPLSSAATGAVAADSHPAPATLEEPAAVSGRAEREAPPAPVAAPRRDGAIGPGGRSVAAAAVRKVARAAPTARDPAPAPIAAPAAALADPAPADRRCVPRALRARLGDRLPAEIAVRFPVAASGAVGRVDVLGGVTDRGVTDAIQEAIRGCPFVPGAGADGRPTALPVVMRIRFAPRAAEAPPAY